MKKLDWFLIKSYIGPFILTFFIITTLFVMQFVWKYVDDLVGKGLGFFVIAELIFYVSCTVVPFTLPIAVLLSSIMTTGNLAESFELTAIKAAGISLARVFQPMVLFICLVSLGALIFQNQYWSTANFKMRVLIYDITRKKPTVQIRENVFFTQIDGYKIKVKHKDENTGALKDIIIYDKSSSDIKKHKTIHAESGNMIITPTGEMQFILKNGRSYEQTVMDNTSDAFQKSKFDSAQLNFYLKGFGFNRSKGEKFSEIYLTLKTFEVLKTYDSLTAEFERGLQNKYAYLRKANTIYNDSSLFKRVEMDSTRKNDAIQKEVILIDSNFLAIEKYQKDTVNMYRAILSAKGSVKHKLPNLDSKQGYPNQDFQGKKHINKFLLEVHRRFTLSFVCFIFFFIGAPLGVIIKKGGLGLPVVFSTILFVVYHVLSLTGSKMATNLKIDPWLGMWLSSIVLFPVGVFLTYKATKEASLMDFKFLTSIFKRKK